MQKMIHQSAVIEKNGLLEIHSPELQEGGMVDITLSIQYPNQYDKPLSNLIGIAKGCYDSSKDVIDFIRRERDQWDTN